MARTLALSLLSVSILGIGCSDEPGGTAGSGASSGTSSGGSGPGECAQATDCPGDAVCDPATGQCTSGLSCAAHTDCGSGAFCDAGTCRDSMPGGPCDDTPNCVSGETCTGGVCGCGGALYGADNVPPNVLIVLDRSGSMNEQITGGTKWDIGRQAINGLVTTYGGGVFFGLASSLGKLSPVLPDGFHPDERYGAVERLRPTLKLHLGTNLQLTLQVEKTSLFRFDKTTKLVFDLQQFRASPPLRRRMART